MKLTGRAWLDKKKNEKEGEINVDVSGKYTVVTFSLH